MRLNSMITIDKINRIIKKKSEKANKIVTFLSGTYLNQIYKILNNGYGQSPFNLLNYKLHKE